MPTSSQTNTDISDFISRATVTLSALVKYKQHCGDILSQGFLATLPSEKDMSVQLEQLSQTSSPAILLEQWQKQQSNTQRDIRTACIRHLSSLRHLRDEHVAPLSAFYPWYSRAIDCEEQLKSFDHTSTNEADSLRFRELINTYQNIVKQAYKDELLELAKLKRRQLYQDDLRYLKQLLLDYGSTLKSKDFILDEISKIEKMKPSGPEAELYIAKFVDKCLWLVQKQLLSRWKQLFDDPTISENHEKIQNHIRLPQDTFLSMSRIYTLDDKAAVDLLIKQLRKSHLQLEKTFQSLRAIQSYVADTDVDTLSFNKKFQAIMAKQLDSAESIKHISHQTPIKLLRKYFFEAEHLKQAIQPLTETLINQSIRTWHRNSLKNCPLHIPPELSKELKDIFSADNLEDCLTAAKKHAKQSKTFQVAQQLFPDALTQLMNTLSHPISDKRILIDSLEQYYRYMLIAAYTASYTKDFPEIKAISKPKVSYYQSMTLKKLQKIYESYAGLKEKYSDPKKAPRLFQSFLDYTQAQRHNTDPKSTDTPPRQYSGEALRKIMLELSQAVSQKQTQLKGYILFLKRSDLSQLIDEATLTSLSELIPLLQHYLLNINERLAQIELALEKDDLQTATRHAKKAKRYLSLVNKNWAANETQLFEKLVSHYEATQSSFNKMAEEVRQLIADHTHFTHPEERKILSSLYKRKEIIDNLNMMLDKLKATHPIHTPSLDAIQTLVLLHHKLSKGINIISRPRSDNPSTRYVPFARQKKQAALLSLRESAQQRYVDELLKQMAPIKERLASFYKLYYPHLSTHGKSKFDGGLEELKIETFESEATLKTALLSGLHRSLSVLEQDYKNQLKRLKGINAHTLSYVHLFNDNFNDKLEKCTDSLSSLSPILGERLTQTGEKQSIVIWENPMSIYQINTRRIAPNKRDALYHYEELQLLQAKSEHEVSTLKSHHDAFTQTPNRLSQETKTQFDTRQLLNLVHQLIPTLSSKINEIMDYLPTEEEKLSDPGLQSMINLHNRLIFAERDFMSTLHEDNASLRFQAHVAGILKHTILDENKQIQLSRYQNGALKQWFRNNSVFRAIIKFFTYFKKSPLVAGASPLEQQIYDIAQPCEQLLKVTRPSEELQQHRHRLFHVREPIGKRTEQQQDGSQHILTVKA